MLANKTYCGYYVTGEISSKKIEDIAIVDEEIWNRAQDFLEQRKRVNEEKRRICRKTQGQVLLSGNIFCAECGGRMVSTSYNSKYIRKDGNVSEYTQFVSWAEEFRQATLEQKRMILSQLIDCVEIGRGYEIRVKMNGSYEQFCGEWVR